MTKQQIVTANAPLPAGPYSQGLKVGDFIYVAGQGPTDPTTRKLAGETIDIQTRQVLENIKAILEAGGATMADVVKSTVHLSDMSLFSAFNAIYATYFPDPKPVRTTVGSHMPGILVEIDVVAYVGK
jgi:2-iminobutanoate/2-iminopropanoate deaminase